MAAQNDNTDAIRILVARGADLTIKDARGRTAMDLAEMFGFKDSMVIIAGANRRCFLINEKLFFRRYFVF